MTHDSSGGTPRQIPSIEQLRQRAAMLLLEKEFGRGQVVTALRVEADALRARLARGKPNPMSPVRSSEPWPTGCARSNALRCGR